MMTTYFGEKNFKLNFSLGPYAEFQLNNNLNELKTLFPNNDFFLTMKEIILLGMELKQVVVSQ